ncbi:F0F1 ATP synthase subunit epsilon [Phenylobacterium montanum]|uniref:F0F1 ATP synthase subunit epsilon n=1 Tax=Phenylobacterium montanum TaxID=2823693 RepID=A0A975IWF4_9CAUL|nr:F0F1 ATP synthase subunit epsilon [Caulobacter sp. S6]QUD89534.1 F0F1 ATP synthase subunit epsilon [Caulobacter sp. S6]
MRLLITTPGAIVADHADITAVRAEDETGEFGVLPHHADLVTALSVSVVGWRHQDGRQGYCAVRGGLLTVSDGCEVAVATREAILGDDLGRLETVVKGRLTSEAEEERQARARAEHLRVQAIRQMIGFLRPQASSGGRDRP